MVLLFFTGCEQKDDTEIFVLENKTQTDVKRIKQQFEAVNLTDAFLKEAFKVKWNQYEVIDNSDGSLTYEFSTNLRSKLHLVDDSIVKSKNTKKIFSVYKLLAIESQDGSLSFEILKFTGNNNKELKEISLSDLLDFNGAINYSTPEGTYIKDEIYNYGILTNSITQKPDASFVSKAPPVGDADDGYVWVREVDVVDWYNVCISCGGGATNPQNRYYRSTTYTAVWTLVPRSTGALYGQAFHSHSDEPSFAQIHGAGPYSDNHFEEIIFDPTFGNSKAECIYNQLNQFSTNFKDAIKKFDASFPVAHLKFAAANLADDTFGQTSPPNDYVITITLNNDTSTSGYDQRPNLLVVKTIIHEVIHAEMFRKMLSLSNQNGNINVATLNTMLQNNDYPGMLDYYTRFGVNGFQHQQMAQHYRDKIARVLQEYDTGNPIFESQTPNQFYLDLAWEGLNKTTIIAWNNAIQKAERDRIDLVIKTYIDQNKNQKCVK